MWKYHLQRDNCSSQCCETVELDDTQCAKTYVFLAHTSTITTTCETIEFGDPVEDLGVATVLMMVGGQLVLLRPRKVQQRLSI